MLRRINGPQVGRITTTLRTSYKAERYQAVVRIIQSDHEPCNNLFCLEFEFVHGLVNPNLKHCRWARSSGVEQWTFNPSVEGSIPSGPTT